jgi:hypothetical protein
MTNPQKNTHPVSDAVFRAVYDSPASLPGRHQWGINDEDVRQIEELLGMPPKTIGAPLWVSGDRQRCPECDRFLFSHREEVRGAIA